MPAYQWLIPLLLTAAPNTSATLERPGADMHGDPLPSGAISRLGSTRFQPDATRLNCIALSPDGKLLATGEGPRVRLWDMATGKEVQATKFAGVSVESIAFSPDGKHFAAVVDYAERRPNERQEQDKAIHVCETATGRVKRQLGQRGYQYHLFGWVGNDRVAAQRYLSRQIFTEVVTDHAGDHSEFELDRDPYLIWDANSGKLDHWFGARSFALSQDGSRLAIADCHLRIADAESVKTREHWVIPAYCWNVALSPEGSVTAAAWTGIGEKVSRVGVWQAESTTPIILDGKFEFPTVEAVAPGGVAIVVRDLLEQIPTTLWNAKSGKLLWSHTSGKLMETGPAVAFAPNGKHLAVAVKGSITIVDCHTGRELRRWESCDSKVRELLFTPDGKTLVTCGDSLGVWDAETGESRRLEGEHRAPIKNLTFSPSGNLLASMDNNQSLRLWDVASGKPLPPPRPGWLVQPVQYGFIAGTYAFTFLGWDLKVRTWEPATGKVLVDLDPGGEGLRKWWDAMSGRICGWRPEHEYQIGPRNRLLAISHISDTRVYDVLTGCQVARDGRCSPAAFWFSPDGRQAIFAHNEGLHLWDLSERRQRSLRTKVGRSFGVAVSPDLGLMAATNGENLRIRNIDGGQGHTIPWNGSDRDQLIFAGDGSVLAALDVDRVLHIYDTATGKELRRLAAKDLKWPESKLFRAPDGRLLLLRIEGTEYADSARHALIDVATGRSLCEFPAKNYAFALSADGAIVAVGGKEVTLREVATGRVIGRLQHGHSGEVTALAFTPDGRKLATGSNDTTVLVWDWQKACGLAPERAERPEVLWEDLAVEDAPKAVRAMLALAETPKETIPMLAQRLKPASLEEATRIRRWIGELDHYRFAVREQATRELRRHWMEAEYFLREANGQKKSSEATKRIEALLAGSDLGHWSPEGLRDLRAIQVLGWLASAEARHVLDSLATGDPLAARTRAVKVLLQK